MGVKISSKLKGIRAVLLLFFILAFMLSPISQARAVDCCVDTGNQTGGSVFQLWVCLIDGQYYSCYGDCTVLFEVYDCHPQPCTHCGKLYYWFIIDSCDSPDPNCDSPYGICTCPNIGRDYWARCSEICLVLCNQ